MADRIWRRPFRVEIYSVPPSSTDPLISSFVTLEDAEEWAQSETEYTDVALVLERDISGEWNELYLYKVMSARDLKLTQKPKCDYYSTGECTCSH